MAIFFSSIKKWRMWTWRIFSVYFSQLKFSGSITSFPCNSPVTRFHSVVCLKIMEYSQSECDSGDLYFCTSAHLHCKENPPLTVVINHHITTVRAFNLQFKSIGICCCYTVIYCQFRKLDNVDRLPVKRVTKRQFVVCKNPADKLKEKYSLTWTA